MSVKTAGQFQNQEFVQNQENIFLGTEGYGKRVVIYDSSGNEVVTESLATGIVSGTKTVTTAGTAVRITASSTPMKGIYLSADIIVGKVIAIGDSGVVANVSGQKGIILIPGNDPVFLKVSDLSLLWIDSQTDGGKLSYCYLQ